jgi:hypothetical protein
MAGFFDCLNGMRLWAKTEPKVDSAWPPKEVPFVRFSHFDPKTKCLVIVDDAENKTYYIKTSETP